MAPSLDSVQLLGPGGLSLSRVQFLGIVAATGVLSYLGLIVYRLFFHPLAKYPGPKLHAISHAKLIYKSNFAGTMTRESIDLHKQYGPIVRIAPDVLAVDGAIAFPQVYQHRPGKPEWPKRPNFFFKGDNNAIIGAERENHRRLRKQLSHAFSDASMYEQEPIVKKYVDLLISRMEEKAATGEVFDIMRWFNFATFDIIGDLMFADSFHSLEGGDYHPWVLSIIEGVRGSARSRALLDYPLLTPIINNFGESAKLIKTRAANNDMAIAKAMARKAQGESPGGRRDFMTFMLKKNRDGTPGYSDMDIMMNSGTLVTAGSETTATSLSGLWVNLGLERNRPVYHKLVEEIRGAFAGEEEITMKSTANLPYLRAVIEENLRLFPPLAETPARVSPGAEMNGEFIPKGTKITVFQNSTYRNPANFADPDSFRPERWLPASHPLYDPMFANDNPDCFRPFSYGTRDCIGKNLAYSELRVIISHLLYRFDYTLAPGQENWLQDTKVFLAWVKPPVDVVFKDRMLKA